MSTETKTEKQGKPVSHVQVGNIRIAIWKNQGEGGQYHKAGLPEISYNKEGTWKNARSLGRRDLVNLAKAALLAHSEVTQLDYQAKPREDGK